MSKMNQLSIEEQEAAYDSYVEEQRQELRKEGAEELRKDILRQIDEEMRRLWDPQQKFGMQVAKIVVERAFI